MKLTTLTIIFSLIMVFSVHSALTYNDDGSYNIFDYGFGNDLYRYDQETGIPNYDNYLGDFYGNRYDNWYDQNLNRSFLGGYVDWSSFW